MTGKQFKAWQKRMGLSVSQTAREFGKDRRAIQRWNVSEKPDLVLALACKGWEAEKGKAS
jgi:hypothetical protein